MFTKTFHPGMPSEYNDSEVQDILIFYPFMILPHPEMAKVVCLCNEAQVMLCENESIRFFLKV